jgi:hypothetical protein
MLFSSYGVWQYNILRSFLGAVEKEERVLLQLGERIRDVFSAASTCTEAQSAKPVTFLNPKKVFPLSLML